MIKTNEKISELNEKLNVFLSAEMSTPEGIKALTDHYKIQGLYNYSFYNSLLIRSQGGKLCQSYKKWQAVERYVKQGEHSTIMVCIPFFKLIEDKKTGKKEKRLIYFGFNRVFDISQTDGKPLQYTHNSMATTEYRYDDIKTILLNFTDKKIKEDYTGDARGYITESEIVISSMSNNTDKIKTLLHEVCHDVLGHVGSDKNRGNKEVEAEACTALILSYCNIGYTLSSDYIANWKKFADNDINKIGIVSHADKIIKAIKKTENVGEE